MTDRRAPDIENHTTRLIISDVSNEPDLFFVLHDLARQMRALADRRAGLHGMTRTQWVTLIWLERQPGLSQKELAELLEVEPITVARIVDRLEARGLIERRADPADRRIWRLHLRPPARPMLDKMAREKADMHSIATTGASDAEIRAMANTLSRFKANVVAELRARPVEAELRGGPVEAEIRREPVEAELRGQPIEKEVA